VRPLVLVVVAACWTGTVREPTPEPVAPKPREHGTVDLEVKLRRTACLGMCPVFEVTIQHDGRLRYVGRQNVAETGERTRRLTRSQMIELSRAVDHAHFFELDDTGHEAQQQGCTTIGGTTRCSFRSFSVCSDTSHTVITVSRPKQNISHTIDDAHCSDDGSAVTLEQKIEELAAPWVGR
jgi:Domain of unknown function (DUF6438)